MKTLRKLKKGIIFTLAFLADKYSEMSIKNFYRNVYYPGYPYKKISLYQTVSRLVKTQEIEKIQKNGEVFLTLKNKAGGIFNEKISLQKLSKKEWDGFWRIVSFDIGEIEKSIRNTLREKLKLWGFAMWQKSVYISPHPILEEVDEFLKVKKLFPKVVAMEAKMVGIKNPEKFAFVVFNLKNLKKEYFNLNEKIKSYKKNKDRKKLQEIIEQFQNLILKDPFLPKGLEDLDWPREKIKKEIKNLMWDLD